MIYIDNRAGSKELYNYFRKGTVELTRLEFADFAFMGNGKDGFFPIGVERKRIGDLVNSMTSGRLAGHQLPGLRNSYEVVYLLIEGLWRPNPRDGVMEFYVNNRRWIPMTQGKRRFMARDVYKYINTLCLLGGIRLAPTTATPRESAQWIQAMYSWWNDKEFNEHVSIEKEYNQYAQFYTKKVPFLQRVFSELPDIGKNKARSLSDRYRTLWDLVTTNKQELMSIEGIGPKIAERIMRIIRMEE